MTTLAYEWGQSQCKGGSRELITPAPLATKGAAQAVETSCFVLIMEVEHNEARDKMANERTRKRGYQRARKDKYPTVALVAEILNELAMPWSSCFAQEGDASFRQGYLIYQDDTPDFEMAVFASPGNIDSLHRSAHWVLDGNFKYRPAGMQQLYSIHGFVQAANGEYEAKTLVAAIMKSRTAKMVVRAQLVKQFGHIGAMGSGGRAHFDFKPAALGAFEALLGPNLTNMCLFHYTNCVNKKIKFMRHHSVHEGKF
uniref:Uncharacterized protein n=1 Tax=Plectus sambesii TaxID=2011161 RepID=A0A914UNM6_9BILA